MAQNRENWGSKLGFILAAAGSAIGLGNIWKFPYIVGENGGAAFIFIYLICIAVIGLPVIIAEILVGRTTQLNPVGAYKKLGNSKFWTMVGGMGVLAGFLILSFYGVISGFSLGYIFEALLNNFKDFANADLATEHYNLMISSVWWTVGLLAVFMFLCIAIVFAGVQKGIEKSSKILMPLLLIILVIMMLRGITLNGAEEGIDFLFNPDWAKVNAETVLLALGHAFFTLSLGMGAMLTYGSYMSKKDSIITSSVQIIVLDTVIAIIAGVAIFTVVFATGQDPNAGPGLIFQTLPVVFMKMPGGYFFSIIFFLLLTIAALTSSISLLEVIVAYFIDQRKWSRKKAAVVFGGITLLLGVPSALSFNVMQNNTIFGLNFFDLLDFITANILLPLGGLLTAVFVGWIWGFDKVLANLKEGSEVIFEKSFWTITFWKFFLKYLSPVLIFIVFLHSLGIV